MVRVILFLLAIAALATGLSWLADRPGDLVLNWEGYEVQTTVFRAVVIFSAILALSVFVFSIARQIWQSPAAVGHYLSRRRQKRGLDALSSGMIAIGAGDRSTATRYAIQARRSLPNEPLTHLLRAQAAQLSGDKATARRIFEAMLGSPDTEQLGLRGLFLEAEHEVRQRLRGNSPNAPSASTPSSLGPSTPCSICSASRETGALPWIRLPSLARTATSTRNSLTAVGLCC